MLGHNQPDEFRTHGVAGRPVLKDLPTTAGRHEKVQTYEVVNPDSGVHDVGNLRASRLRRQYCRQAPPPRPTIHQGSGVPSAAATNMCAAMVEPGEEAAGPNPEPGHSPRPAFSQALPRTRLEALLWAAIRSVSPGSCLRSLTVTHSGGT
jgi:hypothetical protein